MIFWWAQIQFFVISASRWVVFCIFSQFYFPISKKFFSPQFLTKKLRSSNFFFYKLKSSFSWLAHHAEPYSAFLAISIFQFRRNFFDLSFWPKYFDLKNLFFDVLKYSFSWSADHAVSYSAFVANSIFQFQRNFFTSISDQKISILKIDFLVGSNMVFRNQRTTLSHILHL